MMSTSLKFAVAVATAAAMAACSGSPESPTSPTGAAGGSTAAAADGSTLKATAPVLSDPVGGVTVDSRRPTFFWTPSTGTYIEVTPSYELQVMDGGAVIFSAIVGETTFQVPEDAQWDREYTWRVRAVAEAATGPWSAIGTFRTPEERLATRASLPFTVPASCGPVANPPGNRLQCVLEVAAVSPEWGRCQGGSGVGCHRFSRHVAAALATGDPRWGLIGKNPGEQQCTWNRCGGLSGEGYGEDVVAFRHGPSDSNWEGWDLVGGAGAPGARVGWSRLPSRRAGNNWHPVPSPIEQ